jgi:hypothetical protein
MVVPPINRNFKQYAVYEGKLIDTLPQVKFQGDRILSIADIMRKRLESWNSNNRYGSALEDSIFETELISSDGFRYHPDGRLRIVYDSPVLRGVDEKNIILSNNGSIILPNGTFDKFDGEEISKIEVDKFSQKGYNFDNIKEIVNNPILLGLARGDKVLLEEYAKEAIYRGYSFLGPTEVMRPAIPSYDSLEFEIERPVVIQRVNPYNSNIGDFIISGINTDSVKVIGIPDDKASTKNLEEKTMNSLKQILNGRVEGVYGKGSKTFTFEDGTSQRIDTYKGRAKAIDKLVRLDSSQDLQSLYEQVQKFYNTNSYKGKNESKKANNIFKEVSNNRGLEVIISDDFESKSFLGEIKKKIRNLF